MLAMLFGKCQKSIKMESYSYLCSPHNRLGQKLFSTYLEVLFQRKEDIFIMSVLLYIISEIPNWKLADTIFRLCFVTNFVDFCGGLS